MPKDTQLNTTYSECLHGECLHGECLHGECLHCGQPAASKQFCCLGCELIYRTIHDLGAQAFYKYKGKLTDKTAAAAQPSNNTYQYMDAPEFTARHVQTKSEPAKVTLLLEGVHCLGCLWLLEHLPTLLEGVTSSRFSLKNNALTICFNPRTTPLSKIAATLDSLGYPSQPYSTNSQAKNWRITQRTTLLRLGIAAFCAGNIMLVSVPTYDSTSIQLESSYLQLFRYLAGMFFLPALMYSAAPLIRNGLYALISRSLHLDVPITLGILVATLVSYYNLILGNGEIYFDSLAMLILLLLAGRYCMASLLQRIADRSNVGSSYLPPWVTRVRGNEVEQVPVESLNPQDLIRISVGEVLAVDGVVIEGQGEADVAVLTGESTPQAFTPGSFLRAGTRIVHGEVILTAESWGSNSIIARLNEIVDQALLITNTPQLVDRYSRYFTYLIFLGCIILTCAIPVLGITSVLERLLAFTVIACPCALGLAAPTTLTLALAKLAHRGIYIREATALEQINNVTHVIFDKTGTITDDQLQIQEYELCGTMDLPSVKRTIRSLCQLAAHHPITKTLRVWASDAELHTIHEGSYVAGKGIEALLGSDHFRLGSAKWCEISSGLETGTVCYLTRNKKLEAVFTLSSSVRPYFMEVYQKLLQHKKSVSILSGDNQNAVNQLCRQLGIDPNTAHSEKSPEQKAALIVETTKLGDYVMMIGDGLNDLGALKLAHVSVAFRGGIDLLTQGANVVIASADMRKIWILLCTAKTVQRTIARSLWFSAAYNIVGSYLALTGSINPLLAAVAMPCSAAIVIGHAFLSLRTKHWEI